MSKKIPVILNCKAGSAGEKLSNDILASFRASGLEPEILISSGDPQLTKSIEASAKSRPPVIVAAGGDGTISAVARKLAGTDIALGILPVGTLNHFAKDLKLPLKLAEAASIIAKNKVQMIDYATINGRPFINNSSIGIYPSIVRRREAEESKIGKWPAAAMALWRSLRSYQNYRLTLELDNGHQAFKTPLLFVGNNDYRIEKVGISSRQNLIAGHLCVYVAKPTAALDWFKMVGRMLTGTLKHDQRFDAFYTQSLTVKSNYPRLRLAVDGEVVGFSSPFEYLIHPRGLKIILPPPQ